MIPLSNYDAILRIAISRLKDQGHHVRKWALKLMKLLLVVNLEIYSPQENTFESLERIKMYEASLKEGVDELEMKMNGL